MSRKTKDIEYPIARTNMLKIHWDSESVVRALMEETRGGLRVLYQRLPLIQDKKESKEDYFRRVDAAVKQFIAQNLGSTGIVQNYERIAISKGNILFFYLGTGQSNVDDLITWHQQAGLGLEKTISAILQLKLKISYLEDVSTHYDLSLRDANSTFFIGAMETKNKDDISVVDALTCNVYYTAQDEIALSVKSATFKFNKRDASVLGSAVGSVTLHKGSETYLNGDRLSATKASKRPFMEFKLPEALQSNPKFANSGFQNSKNYHLTVCLNKVIQELDNIGIDHSPIEFQATAVIEDFVTATPKLKNDLIIIDCYDRYPNDEIKAAFWAHLKVAFSPVGIVDSYAPEAHNLKTHGVSYLVINPSSKANGSSIVNLTTGKGLNSFWQALAQHLGGAKPAFDFYTTTKIDRFLGERNIVCQGIDVGSVTKTVSVRHGDKAHKEVQLLELDSNIVQKAISELWLKESIFHQQAISFSHSTMGDGEYLAFYCRRTDAGLQYCNVVDLTISGRSIQVNQSQRWDADSSVIFDMTYPFLKGVGGRQSTEIFDAMRDKDFILHEKSTGHSLISYSSGRVPAIIGNALFDNVDRHQTSGIGRVKSPDETPLPYYITKSNAGKMHRVFLQDEGIEGVKYFVSGAKPVAGKIDKQSLVSNVLVYDMDGNKLPAGELSIAKTFFNSFTYDILKNKNSTKKSILRKITEMGLEN